MYKLSSLFVISVVSGLALIACDGDKPADGAPSANTSATTAKATAATTATATATAAEGGGKCEALGCSGEGSFSKMCRCEDTAKLPAVPLEVKKTDGFSFDKPAWDVTNKTDKDIHWASVSVYYYDAAGKQLEATIRDKTYKASRMNGSTFTLKPGETKKLGLGFSKDSAPKGFKDMEVVFDGWCFGTYQDKASHLCIRLPRPADDRPKGG